MNKEEYINHKLAQVDDNFKYQKKRLGAIKLVFLLKASFLGGLGLNMLLGGLFLHATTALSISAFGFLIHNALKKTIKNLYKNKVIETNHLLNLKKAKLKDDVNTNNKRQKMVQELRKKKKFLDTKSSKYTKLIFGSIVVTSALGILVPFSMISTSAFLGEIVVMKRLLAKKLKVEKEYNRTVSRIANLENDLKIIKSSHPKERRKFTTTNQADRENNNKRNECNYDPLKEFNDSKINQQGKYHPDLHSAMIDEYIDSMERTHIKNYENPVQKVKR